MSSKINGKLDYSCLNNHKRLYLSGLVLENNCDNCKKDFSISLADHYPYNIKSNGSCTLSFLCPHCEQECNKNLKIDITISVK